MSATQIIQQLKFSRTALDGITPPKSKAEIYEADMHKRDIMQLEQRLAKLDQYSK